MVNVSANFHTLSIKDAPTTRVRIYFIGDAVDCTDDNDVTTNGTLLKWAVGDTDSNRRIGQDGIKFTEFFNPEYNIEIGHAVSSQIEMTLVNTDGGLNNFTYGRCKVYLDAYDSANSAWLSCPMGVYIIELPTKRKSQMVHAFGYDQMQKLDGICDSWWSGLNWSGGLTMLQVFSSLASQVGVQTSASVAPVNTTITYTDAPFDCVEVTYREVLETIAEATGTTARFDRNGALSLRWFDVPEINNDFIRINTDTVGNQCLNIDVAEYTVPGVDVLNVKLADGNIGVQIGNGPNQYTILNNLFLGSDAATITTRANSLFTRLDVDIITYHPITARMIWDWSIEAGDVVYITTGGTSYYTPIFQQTMTWRGGYVISDLMNSGDPVRPVSDATDRDYYRLDSNMRSLTINADRINLLGYTTINNGFKVNLDGTFEANGATINGDFESNGTAGNGDPLKFAISNGQTSLSISGDDVINIGYKDYSGTYNPYIRLSDKSNNKQYAELSNGSVLELSDYDSVNGVQDRVIAGDDHIDIVQTYDSPMVSIIRTSLKQSRADFHHGNLYGANYWEFLTSGATLNVPVTVNDDLSATTFNSFLKIERTTIANGSTGSINMPNSTSAFLLVSGIRDASKFIASVRANSAGDVSHVEFGTPGATFSVSTNTLTIANNSNGEMQILIFRF